MLPFEPALGLGPLQTVATVRSQSVHANADEHAVAECDVDQRIDRLRAGNVLPFQTVGRNASPPPIADADEHAVAECQTANQPLARDPLRFAPRDAVGADGDDRLGVADLTGVTAHRQEFSLAEEEAAIVRLLGLRRDLPVEAVATVGHQLIAPTESADRRKDAVAVGDRAERLPFLADLLVRPGDAVFRGDAERLLSDGDEESH